MSNVITATFAVGENATYSAAQWQWNKNMTLLLAGDITLPSTYEVHFSNTLGGESVTQIGTSEGCLIPNALFETGKNIYAWVYITTASSESTQYQVTIPIIKRSKPSEDEATPEQMTAIEQAIAALNSITAELEATVVKIDTLAFNINENGELIETYEGGDE